MLPQPCTSWINIKLSYPHWDQNYLLKFVKISRNIHIKNIYIKQSHIQKYISNLIKFHSYFHTLNFTFYHNTNIGRAVDTAATSWLTDLFGPKSFAPPILQCCQTNQHFSPPSRDSYYCYCEVYAILTPRDTSNVQK